MELLFKDYLQLCQALRGGGKRCVVAVAAVGMTDLVMGTALVLGMEMDSAISMHLWDAGESVKDL